jgi:hypothetical protein
MQPNQSDAIPQSTASFSPAYQADAVFPTTYWVFVGISAEGDLLINTRTNGQNSPGWLFLYTLGDRTPAGTDSNSIRPIAAAASYLNPPLSFCGIHYVLPPPQNGWVATTITDLSQVGSSYIYSTTLTSALLNATPGSPGGLNTCPTNPLGVTGQNCTNITISGDPTRTLDGTALKSIQVGDLILIDDEFLRVVAKTNSTNFTVQRGYDVGPYYSGPVPHSGTQLPMHCGTLNSIGAGMALWNYTNDPYGTNSNWTTIYTDPTIPSNHGGYGPGIFINAPDGAWDLGQSLCPSALLGNSMCYVVRLGTYATYAQMTTAALQTVAGNAPFAGVTGIGNPNNVDSHPGPCLSPWCLDARPMFGGVGVGSASSPFVNLQGQLWKASAAQTTGVLNRKFLTTMAYAGRSALVDVSGPGSTLGSGLADSYKYCYAVMAGECVSGSNPGDLYVNTPYVSAPYCYYPGIATPGDDFNGICIGDLGTSTGNMVQVGTSPVDLLARYNRRLGPMYARWNQFYVYWNAESTPSGQLLFSNARWLDGVRHEDLVSILPPYPAADSEARSTFVGVPVKITPPASEGSNVIVEFGYAENGDPNSFFCTSRQETCVAVSNAVNPTNPFFFEQTDSYSGARCALSCTVLIPALSQHVLYYRWKYRDGSGNVIATSGTNAIAVP